MTFRAGFVAAVGAAIMLTRALPAMAADAPQVAVAGGELRGVADAGVTAFKIEGRQRGKAYIAEVVASCRRALDQFDRGQPFDAAALDRVTEGGRETTGAYGRAWR